MAVQITDTAAMALKQTVDAGGLGDGELMRLVKTSDAQIALEPGVPKENDHILEFQGQPLLAVEPAVEEALGDAVVDVGESPQGATLVFRRPHRGSDDGASPRSSAA